MKSAKKKPEGTWVCESSGRNKSSVTILSNIRTEIKIRR